MGLPSDPNELEKIALRRLGLVGDLSSVFGTVEIPWGKAFPEISSDTLKCTSMIFLKFIILSPYQKTLSGQRELRSTVMEFVESTKGTFSIVP